MDYDLPAITDEQIDAYILKRKLRKIIIIVLSVVVIAVGAILIFMAKSSEAEERRLREEELAKYYSSNIFIDYNDQKIPIASDLSKFLKYWNLFYNTLTIKGNRVEKKTTIRAFALSDKCVSSSAEWLGWIGTKDEPKLVEVQGFIKTGDADSCKIENLRVKKFILRSGVIKKGEYSLDIANSTADEVLDYFDIGDNEIRGSNSSRVIRLDALSTDEYRVEYWYDDNSQGEDPIKLVYEYVEPTSVVEGTE